MTSEKARKKADALLAAGDALGAEFPAKSRELLRECRMWRLKTRDLEKKEQLALAGKK
jgi:hypothetical protein